MAEPLDDTNRPLEKNRYGCNGKLLVIAIVLGALALAIFAVYNRVPSVKIAPPPQNVPATQPVDE